MFNKAKTLGFRKWLTLESKKSEIVEATENESFPDRVYSYLSVALGVPVKSLENKPWESIVLSLVDTYKKNAPDASLPILKSTNQRAEPIDWDYPGRIWKYYSHLLAKAYGWTLEYIANLEVNEALAHLQEILTDEQLDREFEYGLSEIAYPYNKNTKNSEFKPMQRPYWMLPNAPVAMKKIRVRRDMLPVGRIVDKSGMPSSLEKDGFSVEKE